MLNNVKSKQSSEFGWLNSLNRRFTFEETDESSDKNTEQNDNKGKDDDLDSSLQDLKDAKDNNESLSDSSDDTKAEGEEDGTGSADDTGDEENFDGGDDVDNSDDTDSSSDDTSTDPESDSTSDNQPINNTKSTLFTEFVKLVDIIKISVNNLEKRQSVINNNSIIICVTQFKSILKDIEYMLERNFNSMNETELYFQLETFQSRVNLILEQLKRLNEKSK